MSESRPLFLSRLVVDTATKAGRRVVADVYHTHRTLSEAFDELVPGNDRVLWRWEPGDVVRPVLLVQSTAKPDWARAPSGIFASEPEVKDLRRLSDALVPDRRLVFALTANASRKVDTKTSSDGTRRNGRRVPLRRLHDQLEWLQQRADRGGFALLPNRLGVPDVRVSAPMRLTGRRGEQRITVEAVRFEGVLVVTDPDHFIRSIRSGIGPARAFGCGLLTVAPLR